jgi:hypothetical protein
MKKLMTVLFVIISLAINVILKWDCFKFHFAPEGEKSAIETKIVSKYMYANHLDDCERGLDKSSSIEYDLTHLSVDGDKLVLVSWWTICLGNTGPSKIVALDVGSRWRTKSIDFVNENGVEDILFLWPGSNYKIEGGRLIVKYMSPHDFSITRKVYVYDGKCFNEK